jgi:lipoprotein-anchoring transpeptidase ErfK/SrfK
LKNTTYQLACGIALACALLYGLPAEAKKHSGNASTMNTGGSKVFVFNPRSLQWSVYGANGNLVRSGHAVGGQGYCPDIHRSCRTPVGSYRIYEKAGAGYKSTRYPLPNGGAPMPYAMFFHGQYAIHGANNVPNRNASHGCIRVYPSDARYLSSILPYGTRVIVRPY